MHRPSSAIDVHPHDTPVTVVATRHSKAVPLIGKRRLVIPHVAKTVLAEQALVIGHVLGDGLVDAALGVQRNRDELDLAYLRGCEALLLD
jgi:hypothetical protein